MFDQLFESSSVVARHLSAPYAEERLRYLVYCARRGDSRATLLFKARELFWVARKLSVYPDLRVTIQQIQVAAHGWQERERACGQKLNKRWTMKAKALACCDVRDEVAVRRWRKDPGLIGFRKDI